MARSDLVEMEGLVKEVLIGGNYRVEVKDGHWVVAQLTPKLRSLRVVLGDRVTVAVLSYDPTRGLIVLCAEK